MRVARSEILVCRLIIMRFQKVMYSRIPSGIWLSCTLCGLSVLDMWAMTDGGTVPAPPNVPVMVGEVMLTVPLTVVPATVTVPATSVVFTVNVPVTFIVLT
jgi:hypothetical protein